MSQLLFKSLHESHTSEQSLNLLKVIKKALPMIEELYPVPYPKGWEHPDVVQIMEINWHTWLRDRRFAQPTHLSVRSNGSLLFKNLRTWIHIRPRFKPMHKVEASHIISHRLGIIEHALYNYEHSLDYIKFQNKQAAKLREIEEGRRIHAPQFPSPCKGSYEAHTACGNCPRCYEERLSIAKTTQDSSCTSQD